MPKVDQKRYEKINDLHISLRQLIDDLYVDFFNLSVENKKLKNEIRKLKKKLKRVK